MSLISWPLTARAPHTAKTARLPPPFALQAALSLLVMLGGCKSHGRVTITLELPAALELNPMGDPRLASFSLTVTDLVGNVRKINTVPYAPGQRQLDIGEIPVGEAGNLTLVGYSDTNQVLAYGETGPLQVDPYESLVVALALRKPYTYIAGGPAVAVFDTTQAHAADVVSPIDIGSPGQNTTAVATTPDGRYLLAAVADPPGANPPTPAKLLVYNTGYHTRVYSVPLNYNPDYLSVSHDGHWAIVSATDASRITVVDIEQVFADVNPADTTRDIVFVAPRRAAFVRGTDGRDLAVILRDPLAITERCQPSSTRSSLSVIDLPDGALLNTTYYDTALADIASRPGDDRVFLADPCQARISVFDTVSYQVQTLVMAQVPRSLIVAKDTLWIGSYDESANVGATAARIAISKVDLSTLTRSDVVATPFLQEGYVLRVDDSASSKVVLRANPLTVSVYHLSVPPGSSRVSALVYATYYGDYRSNPLTEVTPNISEVEYHSFSYVGLDTTSGEIRRRYRGFCFAAINGDFNNFYCCEDLELSEGPRCNEGDFLPRGATSLYGVP